MCWYVIRTKPHQESRAAFHLRQLSVETFLPLMKQSKMVRRVPKEIVSPLFPGYIFARFKFMESHRSVSYAKGVLNIVQFGLKPAEVSESVIEAIKSRMENRYVIPRVEKFQEGQIVHIKSGPLAGLEAMFVREMREHERVLLLLKCLGIQAKLTMDISEVGILEAL